MYCARLSFWCWVIVVLFLFCYSCNCGDHALFYVIYFVSYWMEFLPSYYYVKINWRISELFWSFFFWYIDILIFPILVVGSCLFPYLRHIIILCITIIIFWTFFFDFCIPDELLFISVINIFCSRITKIGEMFIICYLFIVLNRQGSYFSIFFSYIIFLFIFSIGGDMSYFSLY